MMELEKFGGSTIKLSDKVFGQKPNEMLIHQVVCADMTRRRGSKAQKNRSQVSGSGRKPWRQKGTGSARVGTKRNPIWRGGGVAFAATPGKRHIKVNRRMFRTALCSVLSALCADSRLIIDEDIKLKSPKTREMVAWMKERKLDNALIVVAEKDENIELASRNIPNVEVIETRFVDALTLLRFEKVLMTETTVRQIEERLA